MTGERSNVCILQATVSRMLLLFGLLEVHDTEIKSYGYYMQVVTIFLLKKGQETEHKKNIGTSSALKKLKASS